MPEAVERRIADVMRFVAADLHELPFEDDRFDFISCFEVIEHVADASLYLRECARVLDTAHEREEKVFRLEARCENRTSLGWERNEQAPGRPGHRPLLQRQLEATGKRGDGHGSRH